MEEIHPSTCTFHLSPFFKKHFYCFSHLFSLHFSKFSDCRVSALCPVRNSVLDTCKWAVQHTVDVSHHRRCQVLTESKCCAIVACGWCVAQTFFFTFFTLYLLTLLPHTSHLPPPTSHLPHLPYSTLPFTLPYSTLPYLEVPNLTLHLITFYSTYNVTCYLSLLPFFLSFPLPLPTHPRSTTDTDTDLHHVQGNERWKR